MTPDELFSLAENPAYIPGIYNYCDGWCARCKMTARCSAFAASPTMEIEIDSGTDNPDDLMRQIGDALNEAFEMIQSLAEKEGIDMETVHNAAEVQQSVTERHDETMQTPLSQLSWLYLQKTHHWFHHVDDATKAKDDELAQITALQLSERDAASEMAEIKDALDVVNWYFHQIHSKLMRAQMSQRDETREEQMVLDAFPLDSDGSAKVALIGMDNSMAAWQTLLQHFPDLEESILEQLSLLQQLLRMTENSFPNARKVRRPGLD